MLLFPVTQMHLSEHFILLNYFIFLHLVFWNSSQKSLNLCPQFYEPLACSYDLGLQDVVFNKVCLIILLIDLQLLCAEYGRRSKSCS